MFIELGNDLEVLRSAADLCGLELATNVTSFKHDTMTPDQLPGWYRGRTSECDHILRPSAAMRLTMSRQPFEVGVVERGDHLVLIWDDYKEGFGLCGLLGPGGCRLRSACAIEGLVRWAAAADATMRSVVDSGGTAHLEIYMGKATVIVKISPKGDTKFEVQGCEGESCRDLTSAVEKALGTVSASELTDDYYKRGEEHQEIQV